MIEKPEITIAELRKRENQDTIKVFDAILFGLIEEYWKESSFRDLGIGLEGSIEAFEELIDKGLAKIGLDDEKEEFFFLMYNHDTGEYVKAGSK